MKSTICLVAALFLAGLLLATPRAAVAFADNFKDATQIPDAFVFFPPSYDPGLASNAAAGSEAGEPSHRPQPDLGPYRSLWWKVKFDWSGYLTLTTEGSTVDTVCAVYIGSKVSRLTRLVASDDGEGLNTASRVTFPIEAGKTYHIAVDSYAGMTGNVKLKIEECVLFSPKQYVGLVGGPTMPDHHGLIELTTTNSSAVSGAFYIGNKKCPFRSSVELDRKVRVVIPRLKLASA